jgi:tRNA (guanosine-2'-O-)-methyltransferase
MGTERYLDVLHVDSGPEAVSAAHEDGYRVVALELTDQAVPLPELEVVGDVCIVLGNEDHGIKRETLSAVEVVAYIPQLGRVGSLNVAAAAAIVLYEFRRRAWSAK